MTWHPAGMLRRSAQVIRHAPGLRTLTPVWDRLRAPYRRVLERWGSAEGVPVTVGGYPMRLAPDTVSLNWETVEVESYKLFASQIGLQEIVFDVGAHFGTYSIIAVKRGGPGVRVVAYEPCDLTRGYLERHLHWNGVDGQVHVRPVCCGDHAGPVSFFHRPGRPEGINGLLPDEGLVETTAHMTTIDAEAATLGVAPTLLKIDVEGAELTVLQGAERVLLADRPRVLLSVHPQRLAVAGLDAEAVVRWLTARHYECRVVDEDQELHIFARPC